MAEPARYLVPAGEARSEFIVKRSRFVGSVGGASDPEEALAFVERVAGEFRDASHNAWAYRLRIGFQVDSRSDDAGEPGGTAGRPILAAIEATALCDTVVVVTRYFGGIKLGAGGLVRAYGRAAREALAGLETRQKVRCETYRLRLEYAFLDVLRRLVAEHEGMVARELFDAQIEAQVMIPQDRASGFVERVVGASAGRVRPERTDGDG